MKNRGLIISSYRLKSGLLMFSGEIRHDGSPTPLASKVCTDGAEYVGSIDLVFFDIGWLSGPAATKRLAKKFGLELRRRAPGAGRPRKQDGAKAVYVPVWMTPSGRDRLDFLRGKRPRGAFIERHLPLMK